MALFVLGIACGLVLGVVAVFALISWYYAESPDDQKDDQKPDV